MNSIKNLFHLWRSIRMRPLLISLLVAILLSTSIPWVPGMDVPTASASTNMRISPSEINTDLGEKTVISFSFSAADDGQAEHEVNIHLVTPGKNGGSPQLGQRIASGKYRTKNAQGEYIVHEVEWDGTIGGVALHEGKYHIAVSPGDYNGSGVYYGQIGSFEIVNSTQPKAPASIAIEAGASGSAVVKGTAEIGSTVTLEVRDAEGKLVDSRSGLTVNAQGQWSDSLNLAAGQRFQLAARSQREGKTSSYSEIKEVLRYVVPSYPVTWRALAGYYYKADSTASVHARAQEIAAWNGLGNVNVSDAVTGTSVLLINPQAESAPAEGDLEQFTAEAIKKRLRIVNPSWSDVVEPARGDFAYSTDTLTLPALMPLSFGVAYLSRDPYTGANGLGWHHSYEWRLTPVDGKQELMQPDGARFEFVPVAGGSYLTPAGTDWSLRQSGNGHELQTPQGMTYLFDEDGLLTSIRDLNGNEVTLAYQGENLQQVTTDGATFNLSYNGSGQLVAVSDHAGRKLEYGYDGAGDMVSFTDVDGAVTKFSYDGAHHVISVTASGQDAIMRVTYDEEQRVTSLTDFYGSTEKAEYSGKVAPVVREEEDEAVAIDPNHGRDIAESDVVLLSGTMHNLRNAPPHQIVPGLKPVISKYLDSLTEGIRKQSDSFEASASSGVAGDMESVQKLVSASGGSGPVIVRAGQLNVEEGITLGSPSKPVILIADGMNTNQEMTISIYGTLILKQGMNANTKLNLNAYQVGGKYGNIWSNGTIHLNNDSTVQVDDTLYAGVLTYNSGQLTVNAQSVIVRGDLSINTKVTMNLAKEMVLGGIVSNNLIADLNMTQGDLFVRDNVHVNNQMSVKAGGVFAIGGDMVPNQTPVVRSGVGNGKTSLTYPETQRLIGQEPNYSELAEEARGKLVMPATVSATLLSVSETKRTDARGYATAYTWGDRFLLSELRLPDGSNWQYDYDAGHRLAAVTDGNGYRTTASYDVQGNKIMVAGGNRQSTVMRYNTRNLPVEIVNAVGQSTAYSYDAAGNLIAEEDGLGHRVSIARDSRGVPTEVTDPRGGKTQYTLDAAGFVSSIKDPSGYRIDLGRDELHRVVSTRDDQGSLEEVTYDAKGRITASRDALQQLEEWQYDASGNLKVIKDQSGAEVSFGYDVYRMASVKDPLGHLSESKYDVAGNLVEEQDGNGGVSKYSYDSMGRIAKITDADGTSTSYAYDNNGQMSAMTDGNGHTTEYTYNHAGQVLTVKDELGMVEQYKYDAAGQMIKETDALGNSTWYKYDEAGRLIEQTDALGYVTTYAYDAAGNQIETTLPDGSVWSTTYDERGLSKSMIDPLSRETTLDRDARGQVISYTDAEGQATEYQYDALGRTILVRNALGFETKYTYNALGQVAEMVDAKGQLTRFDYDAAGQLTGVVDAAGQTSSYTYDALGNVLTKTNPLGAVTSYSYNGRGLVERTTNPLQEITSISYDGNGNVKSMVAPDNTATQYGYDPRNRLATIQYGDGQQVRYGYDLADRRLTMDDTTGQTRYNYDALGRLTEMIDPRGQNVRYEWTPTGQRSRIIYPDNSSVVYEYDLAGQISNVKDGQQQTTRYTYNGNGQVVSRNLPGGELSNYEYDRLGQLTGITHRNAGGSLLEQLSYVYDPVGNVIHKERQEQGKDEDRPQDTPKSADVEDYTYDALNRLVEVQNLNGSSRVTYAYDAAGNRLEKSETRQGITEIEKYTYDFANKLTHWEKGTDYKNYSYDLRGNLLQVEGVDSAAARMRMAWSVPQDVYGVPQDVYGITNNHETMNGSSLLPNLGGTSDALGEVNPLADVLSNPNQLGVPAQVYGPEGWNDFDPLDSLVDPLMAAALAGPGVLESYEWDAANRLVHHTNPAGDQTEYRYDGDNNRIYVGNMVGTGSVQALYPTGHPAGGVTGWEAQYKKQSSEIYFTYDITSALPEPLYATDDSGTKWKQSYVYGAAGERLSMSYLPSVDTNYNWESAPGASGAAPNTKPETLFYLSDMLGSPLALLNQDSEVALRYHYDEFGTPEQPEKFDLNYPGPDNLFGYTGLAYDAASGLSYARARYFDPGIGRFVSQDTYPGELTNPQSLNLYGYVENNPLVFTDPSGHYSFNAHWNVSLGLKDFFIESRIDTATYLFKSDTYKDAYALAEGLLTGTITVQEIAKAVGKEYIAPFEYVYKHGDHVINGKPTKDEAYSFGYKLGEALDTIGTSVAGMKLLKKKGIGKCNCFTAGTEVLTDEGEKPIEEIEVGDRVLAKDENNPDGELAYKEVTALFRNQRDDIIKLYVGEQIIETTDNHPFYIEGKGWVLADQLQEGDKLQKADGSDLTIAKVEFIKLDKKVTVYNFAVANYHTYYVTDIGIWVHNTNNGDCLPSFVADNRVPIDKETILGNGSFIKTKLSPVKGAQVYKKGDNYYHRDTFHTGNGSHLEVYDKRGNHIGEADPLTGELLPGTRDPNKSIVVK